MSGESSSAAGWSWRLEPQSPLPLFPEYRSKRETAFARPDDPRLGEVIEFWQGDPAALRPGRAVLVGFPQDEGVRRNQGRTGAAQAPQAIRRGLFRLTPWDGAAQVDLTRQPPLDLGNVRVSPNLEDSQEALGEVLAAILQAGAVPVVLGGGHETAYGHYLGYSVAGRAAGVINLDAHLDVRPCLGTLGHSGSPFRQMLEHPTQPLPGDRYVCLGAQPFAVSRQHLDWLQERGGVVRWCHEVRGQLEVQVRTEQARLVRTGPVWLSVDADVVTVADMPGISAPNPDGLSGAEVLAAIRTVGELSGVSSFEVVEVNPTFDRDSQSVRWAALAVWHFLMGLASRG